MKCITCFLFLWLIFCPLGSGSETLVSAVDLIKSLTWSWINTDLTLKLAQIRIRIHTHTLVGRSGYYRIQSAHLRRSRRNADPPSAWERWAPWTGLAVRTLYGTASGPEKQKRLEHRIGVNSKTTEFDLSNYFQLRFLQFIETLLMTTFKSMITLFVQVWKHKIT